MPPRSLVAESACPRRGSPAGWVPAGARSVGVVGSGVSALLAGRLGAGRPLSLLALDSRAGGAEDRGSQPGWLPDGSVGLVGWVAGAVRRLAAGSAGAVRRDVPGSAGASTELFGVSKGFGMPICFATRAVTDGHIASFSRIHSSYTGESGGSINGRCRSGSGTSPRAMFTPREQTT